MTHLRFMLPMLMVILREDPTPQQTINTAVSTGLQTLQNDALTLIGTIIPYAIGLMAAVAVVLIGIRVFKKISGARS